MPSASDRFEFTPPPPPGMLRAFALAIAAHILLMLALTWGVSWKREAENISAEAELWSATPQQAAPKPIPAPPPPPPAPAPTPAPAPAPVVKAPPPPPPMPSQADIALERDRKQAELKKQQDEARKIEARKIEAKKAEARQADELKKRQLAQKAAEDKKKADELKKQQLAQKAAEDKRKADATKTAQAAQQAQDTRRVEALRQENLNRMQGLAGATGAPSATGTAQRASGPSASYAGRIIAKVRPNIVFTEDMPGNPKAEVEVRMALDGTITSTRLLKSSGVKSWDDAVLRALVRTEMLPKDTDGRIQSPMVIEFRPKS